MVARIRLLLLYLGYWLLFFTVTRFTFLGFHFGQASALGAATLAGTEWHGFRLDLSGAAYLSLIPFLLVAASTAKPLTRWAARLLIGYTLIATTALSLLAAADLEVFRSWGRRIDASVVQYFTSPREIWASAGGGSPWLLLAIFGALAGSFGRLAWRVFRPRFRALVPAGSMSMLLLLFPAALLVLPARGGFQQIPINQSSAYFSSNPFANQAALNAGWNFFDTWLKRLDRRDNPYRIMPADSAAHLVALKAGPPGAASPLRTGLTQPVNVLLIVWEGLTARAVASLGGVAGATPEFDRWVSQGLLFRRFFAAGDRTEKGLAALLSAAPTVPNASILMVPAKAATLPTLPADLGSAGYATSFYYGGELDFANLRSYVLHGRFDRILGKADLPSGGAQSKWGAHDEVVADRVLADLHSTREPFFTTWLTLSSHEPFDVPGPVRVPGEDGESRFLNSLAYTDDVVGRFLRRAEAEPWWERTLVVIVADHSKKLERTDAAVPWKSAAAWYQVPMLWTGGAIGTRGASYDGLASQLDLAPTLLGLLGLPVDPGYRFGRRLFGDPFRPWVYYGFDDGFGLVTDSGSLVWEHLPDRITSSTGRVGPVELRLGKAMLQVTYQDYLDR